jgi:putative membrane protein
MAHTMTEQATHGWLVPHATPADVERIEEAVARVELQTCAEIVPMIVRSSSSHGHVPYMLFLISLFVLWTLVPYATPFVPSFSVALLDLAVLLVAFIVASWGMRSDYVRRTLTPKNDQAAHVMRRAQLEFYQSNIKQTEQNTGVLIFVSLLERRAVVLADQAVSEKLPPETWQSAIDALITRVKDDDFTGGMCAAIEQVGAVLSQSFPSTGCARNELPNHLIIKE